jgi:drug/metabolite transporter (DMT)-like permease
MNERVGVLAAILSSTFGGMAAAVTRFVIGSIDPVSIAAFRFGLGFLFLLPVALVVRSRWPAGRDWIGAALLGLFFFAFFFVLYNVSFGYTTAARGTLALSTLPLLTMLVAAALGAEPLTLRKSAGVAVAMAGVAFALLSELENAPVGAWRGDLLMIGGTLCMAFYNVWARPFMARSSPLGFVTACMGFGGGAVTLIAWLGGGLTVAGELTAAQWLAVLYLGLLGGAAAFYLWNFALERATPTRVANTLAINPLAAAILAAILLGEPIGLNLIAGIGMVFVGIWVASTGGQS